MSEEDLWIWDKLHWFNFPDLPERPSSQDEHLKKRILPSVNFNDNNPTFVYLYNGRIRELENIEHSQETVDFLNKVGVTFYLNEPLCIYEKSRNMNHTLLFYSELLGNEVPENLRADELTSIRFYVIRHKLTNVKVKTCDYDSGKHLPFYQAWMDVSCEDTCVKNAPQVVVNVDRRGDGSPYDKFFGDFSKKFMNLNWRWTPHRNLIAAYLAESSSQISYFYKSDVTKISNLPWFDLNTCPKEYQERIYSGLSFIDTHGPFCLDIQFDELLDITDQPYPVNTTLDNYIDPSIEPLTIGKFYENIFCDVVTESRFAQPTANYSEKSHQPMWYKKPFIVMAPPKTLQYLREQGFQTFSDYWDESYDLCENHAERLYKIFDVINYIESKSIEELQSMYEDMKPILLHNFNQVKKNIYDWLGTYVIDSDR